MKSKQMRASGSKNGTSQDGYHSGDNRSLLSIGEIADQYNITLRTLRFYESSGLLHPERRGTTRLYSPSDCVRVELILKGRQFGFSLAEIKTLISKTNRNAEVKTLESVLDLEQIIAQIQNLERQRGELDNSIKTLREELERMTQTDRTK